MLNLDELEAWLGHDASWDVWDTRKNIKSLIAECRELRLVVKERDQLFAENYDLQKENERLRKALEVIAADTVFPIQRAREALE